METLAVIWAPVRTLASVAEERRVLLAFGIVALSAILGLVSVLLQVFGGLTQVQAQQQPGAPGLGDFQTYFDVFALVSAVVSPFAYWLVIAGLMQLITRFFGGSGPFSGMLAVVGVAQVTLVISGLIGIPLISLQIALGEPPDPTAGSPAGTILFSLSILLGLAFLLWYAALVVIGAAFARRVGYGQSAGSCAISCTGLVGLILILVVGFFVLVFVLVGAAGQGGSA